MIKYLDGKRETPSESLTLRGDFLSPLLAKAKEILLCTRLCSAIPDFTNCFLKSTKILPPKPKQKVVTAVGGSTAHAIVANPGGPRPDWKMKMITGNVTAYVTPKRVVVAE